MSGRGIIGRRNCPLHGWYQITGTDDDPDHRDCELRPEPAAETDDARRDAHAYAQAHWEQDGPHSHERACLVNAWLAGHTIGRAAAMPDTSIEDARRDAAWEALKADTPNWSFGGSDRWVFGEAWKRATADPDMSAARVVELETALERIYQAWIAGQDFAIFDAIVEEYRRLFPDAPVEGRSRP